MMDRAFASTVPVRGAQLACVHADARSREADFAGGEECKRKAGNEHEIAAAGAVRLIRARTTTGQEPLLKFMIRHRGDACAVRANVRVCAGKHELE